VRSNGCGLALALRDLVHIPGELLAGSAFDRSVLKRCSRGTPFRQWKGSVARLFRKSLSDLILRIERLLQGDVRFDSLLDLVKRKTEFTRRTTWSPAPRVPAPHAALACATARQAMKTHAALDRTRLPHDLLPSGGKQRRDHLPVFFGDTHSLSIGPRTRRLVP
jgi:hypothetical protein